MPILEAMEKDELENLEEGGGLKEATLAGRKKVFEHFASYWDEVGGQDMAEAFKTPPSANTLAGHRSAATIVQNYDLNLEARGLAEMAGAMGNGPREAMGDEVALVRLGKRKSVEEDKGIKVPRQETGVGFDMGKEKIEGAAITSGQDSTMATTIAAAEVKEDEKNKENPAVLVEGFEESLDLADIEVFEMAHKEKQDMTKSSEQQSRAKELVSLIQPPLVVAPDAMTVTDDLSRTTALVMGQMAGQMFSGMLKTLLDAKSSKS